MYSEQECQEKPDRKGGQSRLLQSSSAACADCGTKAVATLLEITTHQVMNWQDSKREYQARIEHITAQTRKPYG